ncbi:hypothetical protein Tco_0865848 [Tanacetum coccineum]
MAVKETLKAFGLWLCGKCMDLDVVSRACHHSDGLVHFPKGSNEISGYIVGISNPSNKEHGTEVTQGLVLDAELLDHVFKVSISTVKCIPHGCRLAFSQELKTVLYKVYRPKNRQENRSRNRKSLQQRSFGHGGGDFLEERATGNTNIKQRLRKVTNGHFTAAVKVLSSSGVAPYCDDTIKALEAKHPYKPPPSMPSIAFSEPPLIAEIDSVFGCIKSFLKGTSCGRDGLRAQHILDALCGEGFVTATNLLKVITSVVNLWLVGRCLPILIEFVASTPLTPLLKPDNQIRPIVVGIIWRCLVSKCREALRLLHNINRVLSEYHNDGSLAMLIEDFSNAFNHADRSALLYEVRVRTVIGDSEEVSRVLDIIKVSGPGLGLELNIKKTEIFCPSCNDGDVGGVAVEVMVVLRARMVVTMLMSLMWWWREGDEGDDGVGGSVVGVASCAH